MAEDLPQGEIIGIVIGAIVLFSIISIVPIVIMWHHRRRAANRSASGTHNRTISMREPSVERWLAEQNPNSDPEQYAQDICPICLSSLSSSPYLADPEPVHLAGQPGLSPARSEDSCSCGARDARRDSGILVLNRCHHAFHFSCLTSWFEYRRYQCPICQASYSPAKAVRR
ncbi:uncharacterized protein N7498_004730 [Penicillium cinerascens]|uniref:RING-type domain-containing protein n=1 Tax=Penicillium cinerascens TaxID=70096 RepID=A0A9W9MM14_9EURO|nr:uncharacterized protein N7498_004730 [Penicillium cinerascens]KAJ5203851.1 hypothetical protein N7498_004730 [Penicillium cinerascens]